MHTPPHSSTLQDNYLDLLPKLMRDTGLDTTEDDLENAGVRVDCDMNGNEVLRDFPISWEWRQHVKCCSSETQRALRQTRINAALDSRQTVLDKDKEPRNLALGYLVGNEAVEIICQGLHKRLM